MSIFYKNKIYRDQYEKARFNGETRSDARSKAELVTLSIYAILVGVVLAILIFVAIVIYTTLVFLNSPGIGALEFLKLLTNLNIGIAASWFISVLLSAGIYLTLYKICKSEKLLVNIGIYIILCIVISAPCFFIYDEANNNIAQKILKSYAPIEFINKKFDIKSKSDHNISSNNSSIKSKNEESKLNRVDQLKKEEILHTKIDEVNSQLNNQSARADNVSRTIGAEATVVLEERILPSFDCNKALYLSEKIICSSQELSDLDRKISLKYKNLRRLEPNNADLKSEQINWIENTRQCSDEQCLLNMYKARIIELNRN